MIVLGEVPVDVDDPIYLTWKAIDKIVEVIELLGWYVLEEDDQSEWREQAGRKQVVEWYHENKTSATTAIDKLRKAIVAKAVEGTEMTSKDTTQHELNTTQRELNAAIYYTWKAIDKIEDALIYLKWMVEEGKDGKRSARALDKCMTDLFAIRDKYVKERLRIVMEDKASTMEDSGDD